MPPSTRRGHQSRRLSGGAPAGIPGTRTGAPKTAPHSHSAAPVWLRCPARHQPHRIVEHGRSSSGRKSPRLHHAIGMTAPDDHADITLAVMIGDEPAPSPGRGPPNFEADADHRAREPRLRQIAAVEALRPLRALRPLPYVHHHSHRSLLSRRTARLETRKAWSD